MTYQEIKANYSIDDFMGHFGFQLIAAKSTRNSRVFKNATDIIITKVSNNTDLYFNPLNDSDNGDLINFLLNRVNQDNPVLNLNRMFETFKPIPFKTKPIPYLKQQSFRKFNNYTKFKASDYSISEFLKSRFLSEDKIDLELFLPTIFSVRKDHIIHQDLFIELDDSTKIVAAQYLQSKMFFPESRSISGLYKTNLDQKDLLISEHINDAMAFSQIQKNYSHISTCGSLTPSKIQHLISYKNSHNLHISFDADIAGLFFDLKLFFYSSPIRLSVSTKQKTISLDGSLDYIFIQSLKEFSIHIETISPILHTIYINSTGDFRKIALALNSMQSDLIFVKPPEPFKDWNDLIKANYINV